MRRRLDCRSIRAVAEEGSTGAETAATTTTAAEEVVGEVTSASRATAEVMMEDIRGMAATSVTVATSAMEAIRGMADTSAMEGTREDTSATEGTRGTEVSSGAAIMATEADSEEAGSREEVAPVAEDSSTGMEMERDSPEAVTTPGEIG